MTFGIEIAVAVGPQGPKGNNGDTGVKAVLATTTDITLSGEQTIDGTLTSLTRVLVKDQVDQTENGVWVTAAGAWTRATNFDTWPEITGSIVTVIAGDENAGSVWLAAVPPTGVVGTDNIVFSPVSGGGVGTGTVTSVSVTTANGVSGTVATPSSTPAITLTLGAITPTSVAASGSVSGSNLSGTNTGDQTITLTGMVTGSGSGSFVTTIAAGVVTNSMLAGGIAASKLVGTDISTVGTITTGTWNATAISGAKQTVMVGDSGSGGTQGAVPAPAAGDAAASKYLKADGTWSTVLNTGGTVTSVSGVNASGVSVNVANPTTTPAITVVLGNVTPASVNATGLVLGSNLQGTNTGDQTITLTGDVSGSGTGSFAATIGSNVVTNAKLAQMAAHTYKGNNTGSTANAADITATQLTADLDLFSSTLKGLTPLSGGGTTNFLRADGTWASPGSGSGTVTSVSVVDANGVSASVADPTTTPALTFTLGAITPSSVAASGTVGGSNLSGTNTGDQTITLTGDVTGSGTGSFAATIASGAVTNAKIAAAAGIAVDKLAAKTPSTAAVFDSSGFITSAATTATEIGYVNGVTSSIQNQLDAIVTADQTNMHDLGAWDTLTNYVVHDVVSYNGIYYVSILASLAAQPDISPTDWSPVYTQQPVLGTPNNVSGYDNAGVLYSIPGWSVFTNTGGLNQSLTQQPNDLNAGLQINTIQANFDPLQSSPNDNFVVLETSVSLDPNNTGFDLGTNGRFVTAQSIDISHQGTSNVGQLVGRNAGFDLGNGTDPIDVRGISGDYIFGDVHSGVNLSAGVEGYHFNVHLYPGSTISSSGAYSSAYTDNAQFETSVPGYGSFNCNARIDEIQNNNNFTGMSINAQVGNLDGNANYTGIGLYGSIDTMGTNGGYNGIQINPTITHLTANSHAIGIYGNTTDGTAEWIGVDVSPSGINTTGNIRGVRINVPNSTTSDHAALEVSGRTGMSSSVTLISGQGQASCNNINGNLTIPNGTAITGTDTIGNNLAVGIDLGDSGSSWTPASVVGMSTLGFVGTIQGAGTANGPINFCLNGFADLHTGHVDRVNNFFAAGIPTGAGGSMDEHVLYYGDMPAGAIATTEWGIRMDYADGENYVPRLAINTTDKKVSGASVGLELAGSDRAFLPSRMTTTERDALTPVDGMFIYNTTSGVHQGYQNGAWVSMASGGGGGINSYSFTWAQADGATKIVNHGLGTRRLTFTIYDLSDFKVISVDEIELTDVNNVTFSASEAPGISGWEIVIQG